MTLSDKIMTLRRQKGWSQEELADRLGVSRQAVSKWESGTAQPELGKVTELARLLGVRVDDLLSDEAPLTPDADIPAERHVTPEEATTYLSLVRRVAWPMSLAVMFLIFSPITLILLAGGSEYIAALTEEAAAAIGVGVLLCIIAAAVPVLVVCGMRLSAYDWMEREPLHLPPALREEIAAAREKFAPVFRTTTAVLVSLFILSVVPLALIGALYGEGMPVLVGVGVLLFLCGIGVCLVMRVALVQGGYDRLLQLDEFSPERKRGNARAETVGAIYWCSVTAIYLAISFLTDRWDRSWIVWPVAGVLYPVVLGIINAVTDRNR